MRHPFSHENLDAYRVMLDVHRWLVAQRWAPGLGHVKDQANRASASVLLNIAEGTNRTGNARRNHLRIAKGSAAEVCACLDIAGLPDSAEQQTKLRRVGAMLARMAR